MIGWVPALEIFSANSKAPHKLDVSDKPTDFILLSTSGTTPSISGYSGTLLFSATATAGNIKVTDTSNLLKAAGYCGYTDDASAEPSDCSGNSLSEVGFRGSQDDINTAIATLSFKGDGSTGSPSIVGLPFLPHEIVIINKHIITIIFFIIYKFFYILLSFFLYY